MNQSQFAVWLTCEMKLDTSSLNNSKTKTYQQSYENIVPFIYEIHIVIISFI